MLAGIEFVLLWWLAAITSNYLTVARFFLPRFVMSARAAPTSFGGMSLTPLGFVAPLVSNAALWGWVAASLAGIAVTPMLRFLHMPLRMLLTYNFLILAASSLCLLLVPSSGYQVEQFSLVYLTTTILMWFVLPVVVWTMCLSFPVLETLAAIVICVVYLYLLSAVRYAAFTAALALCGRVIMANLYLVFGPLLDFWLTVSFFSFFLPALTRQVRPEEWMKT